MKNVPGGAGRREGLIRSLEGVLRLEPRHWMRGVLCFALILGLAACGSVPKTQVHGNLASLSSAQKVAVLPVESGEGGKPSAANMFRRSLYANLKAADLKLMERYVVDGILKQHKLTDPAEIRKMDPMKLGEILGADVVVFSQLKKVKRTYFILHSSIELGVSVNMVDTRSGEVIWQAQQTESDFSGLAKIPTGMFAAVVAPISFVTNKLNLKRMTSTMTKKLTAMVRDIKPGKPKAAPETEAVAAVPAPVSGRSPRTSSPATEPRIPDDGPEIQTVEAVPASADRVPLVRHAAWQETRPALSTAAKTRENPFLPPVRLAAGIPADRGPTTFPQARPVPAGDEVPPYPFLSVAKDHRIPSGPPSTARPEPAVSGMEPKRPTVSAPVHLAKPGGPGRTFMKTAYTSRLENREPRPAVVSAAGPARPAGPQPAISHPGAAAHAGNPFLYTIQVGAYKTKHLAKKLIQKLARKGYNAFLTLFSREDGILYKVQVEKFPDKKQAVRFANRLQTREHLNNFVTAYQPG